MKTMTDSEKVLMLLVAVERLKGDRGCWCRRFRFKLDGLTDGHTQECTDMQNVVTIVARAIVSEGVESNHGPSPFKIPDHPIRNRSVRDTLDLSDLPDSFGSSPQTSPAQSRGDERPGRLNDSQTTPTDPGSGLETAAGGRGEGGEAESRAYEGLEGLGREDDILFNRHPFLEDEDDIEQARRLR